MATEKMLLFLIKRYEEKNRADKSIGVPKKRKLKRLTCGEEVKILECTFIPKYSLGIWLYVYICYIEL